MPTDVANALNKYFNNVGHNSAEKLPTSEISFEYYLMLIKAHLTHSLFIPPLRKRTLKLVKRFLHPCVKTQIGYYQSYLSYV